MDYLQDLLDALDNGLSVDDLAYVYDTNFCINSVTIEHDDGSLETVYITFKYGYHSASSVAS
jgi:hypothetical protein